MAQWLDGPGLGSTGGSSWLSVTPVAGDMTPSSGLHEYNIQMMHRSTRRQNTHTHTNKKNNLNDSLKLILLDK